MRYSLILVFVISTLNILGQIPAKKYKWKHLGPFTKPESMVDSGIWTAVGQGWIEDIELDGDVIYAGSITGGLYCTANRGKKWNKIDQDSVQMGTLCLLRVGDTLYRGTGVTHYDQDWGVGLLKSIDGGMTWKSTSLTFQAAENKPIWSVSASKSGKNMAACTPNQIFLSENYGVDWYSVFIGKELNFRRVLFDPNNENRFWACGSTLLETKDLGTSWTNHFQGVTKNLTDRDVKAISRIDLALDSSNKNRILLFFGVKYGACLIESIDDGESWNKIYQDKYIRRADIHHTEVAIAPDNPDFILLGTFRAYVSKDGGKSFREVTSPEYQTPQFVHDDIRSIRMLSSNDIYLATDGGVFHSVDQGESWIDLSGTGLTAMQIYGIHGLGNNKFLMGTQDMGYFLYNDGNWSHLGKYYGDGGDAMRTSKGIYVLLGGRVRRLNIENTNKSKRVHPFGGNPFIAKFVKYPNTIDSFFYVGKDLWLHNGENWIRKTKNLNKSDHLILGLDINKKNPKQLFVSYDQPTWNSKDLKNKLFKSIDGGENWLDITASLPILAWRHVTAISSNESDPNEIIVSLGKNDEDLIHKSYISYDGGESWSNYSDGLPPFETFSIHHINNGSSGVIISTLKGLYYRNKGMDMWRPLSGDIDPIVIRDFEIDAENRVLSAGTYGRGFWQMRIPKKMLEY